ncbi:MAG: hypothetical protein OQK12_18685, partial [Motiliproteus sp.]|nr:hypothetical protein [Motiliproteus sp.]
MGIHRLLRLIALCAVLINLSTASYAEDASTLFNPTNLIQNKLEGLGPAEEGDNQQLKEIYQQTLQYLQEQQQYQDRTEQLKQLITNYGPRSDQLQQQLDDYQSSALPALEQMSSNEALQQISVTQAQLLDLQN